MVTPQIIKIPHRGLNHEEFKATVEDNAMAIWQKMYEKKTSAWVEDIIPHVSKPIHSEMNFYLAKGLSGVGCFRSYLHKLGKVSNRKCPCGHEKQSAEHILRYCPDYSTGRPTVLDVSEEATYTYIEKTMETLRGKEKECQ